MVNFCANAECGKPLLYLREGRIFLFDVATGTGDADGKRLRHLEHFWLCGACSQNLTLIQDAGGVRVIRKMPSIVQRREEESVAAGVPF